MANPFEDLSDQIKQLHGLVAELLAIIGNQPAQVEIEKPLSRKEAAKFLGVSYGILCGPNCKVPSHRKFGKYYYLKSELIEFLKSDDEE